MYLLFYILCDVSLILAAKGQLKYSYLTAEAAEYYGIRNLELLSDPYGRLRRSFIPNSSSTTSTTSTTSAALYTEAANPSIPPLLQHSDHSSHHHLTTNTTSNEPALLPRHDANILTSANESQRDITAAVTRTTTTTTPPFPDLYNHAFNLDSYVDESLKKHNISEKKADYHVYYNSTRTEDVETARRYWVDFTKKPGVVVHPMLSQSHRRAVTVPLPFKFQFYGHEIENVTITTGGFLYTGDYIHSWLAATQYIAPLMANFDTSLLNDSYIKYASNETAFTVLWENVSLQDRPLAGNFTFETTLYKNGDIVFVYERVPNVTKEITEDHHPVKVGLSDAYILDSTIFFIRRKTIFEYHRVHFDKKDLKNWTAIYFKPLPTCLSKTTCESCLTKDISFDCQWCDGRCSDGIDRKKHDWVKRDCEKRKINETKFCSLINEKVPIPGAHKADYDGVSRGSKNSSSVVFLVIVTLGGIFSILLWTMYAYRNPHSTSGQILIRYRPSQWSSWRKGEARYTAATIHM